MAHTYSFSHALDTVRQEITKELKLFFASKKEYAQHTDHLHVEMVELLEEYALRGGKRTRGFLTYCGYNAPKTSTKEPGNIYKIAAAVELFHFFLLNLDDIADRDIIRHGGPTLEAYFQAHLKHFPKLEQSHFARSYSEIACNLLLGYAYELAFQSGFPPESMARYIQLFTKTMYEDTSIGWRIHIEQNFQPLDEVSIDRYTYGQHLVTGQYSVAGPLLIGATFSGGYEAVEPVLVEYAKHMGVVYQIQDDLIGIYTDETESGKSCGNDLREGKKTLLVQYAWKFGTPEQKAQLAKILHSDISEEVLEQARQLFADTGAKGMVLQREQDELAFAYEVLEKNRGILNPEIFTYLWEIAEYFVRRTS